jgi:hypothetical protein
MSLPGIGTHVKTGKLDGSLWTLEWTYTDGSGAVLFDATKSDSDERVATPVADGGTGLTLLRFPKCRRATVLQLAVTAAVSGTSEKQVTIGPIDAAAGTLTMVICTAPSTLADPPSGARGRCVLLLEAI